MEFTVKFIYMRIYNSLLLNQKGKQTNRVLSFFIDLEMSTYMTLQTLSKIRLNFSIGFLHQYVSYKCQLKTSNLYFALPNI